MRVVPVLDVLAGQVVRGVAGRRHEYKPMPSRLTTSTEPVAVATALCAAFQPQELYLADLDALQGGPLNLALYSRLTALGVAVWVDAGLHDAEQVEQVLACGCDAVLGLESLPTATDCTALLAGVPPERLLFSLDLRQGAPWHDWGMDPVAMVDFVHSRGIGRVIVLDITRVGVGEGPGPMPLLKALRERFPELEMFAAGGVRDEADVVELAGIGLTGVLVASALHDGRLAPTERIKGERRT